MKRYLTAIVLILLVVNGCKKEEEKVLPENIKPTAKIISPQSSHATIGDSIKIAVEAKDEDGTVKAVLFYQDGHLCSRDNLAPWEYHFTFPEKSSMRVSVVALDDRDALSIPDDIDMYAQQGNLPVISIYGPYKPVENHPLKFSISSQSPNGSIIKTDFYLNDNLYATDTSGYLEVRIDSLKRGAYKAYAIVEDEAHKIKKSDDELFEVEKNYPPEVEIHTSSSITRFPGSPLVISIDADDAEDSIDSLFVFVDDSLFYRKGDEYNYMAYFYPQRGGIYKFHALAYDTLGNIGYSDTIEVPVVPGLVINNKLVDLTYSNYSELVFGLDQENGSLLLLNPISESKQQIQLPYPEPIKFTYSPLEEKLFIAYKDQSKISIWDQQLQEITNLDFPAISGVKDIVLDDLNKRIYLAANSGLHIINMDNSSISTFPTIRLDDIDIAPENQWLFGCIKSGNNVYTVKYNVQNDQPESVQTKTIGGINQNHLTVNNKYDYLFITGVGNSGSMLAFDTYNLNNITGEFVFNDGYRSCTLSGDGEYLYASLGIFNTEYIAVMNAANFTFAGLIPIPASDHTLFCTNYEQNKLIVYTHNDNKDRNAIYFLDNEYR